jgi:hypothetical protein
MNRFVYTGRVQRVSVRANGSDEHKIVLFRAIHEHHSISFLSYGSPEMRCPRDRKSKDNGRLYKDTWTPKWEASVASAFFSFRKKSKFMKENTPNIKTKN